MEGSHSFAMMVRYPFMERQFTNHFEEFESGFITDLHHIIQVLGGQIA